MKKYQFVLIASAFMFCISHANAQLELKVDPLDFIFNSSRFSIEYLVNDKIGIELNSSIKYGTTTKDFTFFETAIQKGHSTRLMGKYYLDLDGDTFQAYGGAYGGLKKINIDAQGPITLIIGDGTFLRHHTVVGLTSGFKLYAQSGFVFDMGGGLGKTFIIGDQSKSNSPIIDFFLRASFGYRF